MLSDWFGETVEERVHGMTDFCSGDSPNLLALGGGVLRGVRGVESA